MRPRAGGTKGYDDLRRRRTSREYFGHGVRRHRSPRSTTSRGWSAARGRDEDIERLLGMRRLAELERSLRRTLELEL